LAPTEGELRFRGADASRPAAGRPEHLRQAMQIVFQNPDSTLNPRHRVGTIIGRPLQRFGVRDRQARREQVLNLLRQVRLDESYVNRKPTQLSGGEKQRVAIARAFAGGPSLVVCDEAVSALDVSVQASILNLLIELRREQQCGYLFISHDLSVVRYLSDRIGVMYLGQLMEIGSVERIFEPPSHPYTEALLSAVQVPDPHAEAEAIRLEGPVPSAIEPPEGCPFHTRCPRRDLLPEGGKVCEREVPPWRKSAAGHSIFCHIPLEQLATRQHSRASSLDAGLNH
jgi:peptide/nickel transport system ATP-binding protein